MRLAMLWTRKCRGCAETDPHDSHLTWLGRLYFRWFAGRAVSQEDKT